MNYWISSQTANEASRDLRENYQTIENTKFFFYSIFAGILSAYFLTKENWIMVFVMVILLGIILLPRVIYLNKRRKELITSQKKINEHCKLIGLPVPEGYK